MTSRPGARRWNRTTIASGNGAANSGERFRRDILPHIDTAYNLARYLARDATAAEDIVQDAFLRALKAIDQCRGEPRHWLLAIVRNCYRDWARAHGRQLLYPVEAAGQLAGDDDPAAIAEARDESQLVRLSLEALPEPFRETLVLRELEELPYRDIARLTGVPVGTVMSRLSRGRAMLAALLLGEDDEGCLS